MRNLDCGVFFPEKHLRWLPSAVEVPAAKDFSSKLASTPGRCSILEAKKDHVERLALLSEGGFRFSGL